MSPYLDTLDLAEYLRFIDRATGKPDRQRAHRWLTANRVPYKKRGGRAVLVRREDVDAKLEDA